MNRRVSPMLGLARATLAIAVGLGAWGAADGSLLRAQEPATAVLEGQVVLGDQPLPDVEVVLHRVGSDTAGELDSIPANPDGSFRFELPYMPDPENRGDVFFASVSYRGILYFGPPITRPVQLDSAYVIQAYDTVAAVPGGADLPVRVRNLFLEGDPSGWHATDLIQIGNEGDRTLVARPGDVTWSYPLPTGASSMELGQGDFSPDQVNLTDGRIDVGAPIPPGDRLLVLRYDLPGLFGEVPFPGRTERAELLIREPVPEIRVGGLERIASVELESDQVYQRYLAADLNGATISIAEAEPEEGVPVEWLAVLLALVLAGAGVWAFRRRGPRGSGPRNIAADRADGAGTDDRRSRILLAIASLDRENADLEPGSERSDAYHERREELLAELRGAPES